MVISPASATVIETLLLFLQFNFAQAFSHFLLSTVHPSFHCNALVGSLHFFPSNAHALHTHLTRECVRQMLTHLCNTLALSDG